MYYSKSPIDKKDKILMQLAHYFIVVENYAPIVVKGVQNEIWLENINAPYRIIRINKNYIHNDEQLGFDLFKIKNIVKQVKRKTLSFSVNTLNILLDVGTNVHMKNGDKIDCIAIDPTKGIKKSKELNSLYPLLKDNMLDETKGLEFILSATTDINLKTIEDNREYEEVFSKKTTYITYILIALNVLLFIISQIGLMTGKFDLYSALALHRNGVRSGGIYRLLTACFMHRDLFHLLTNMYALFVIGSQVETYMGKPKYLTIYLFSGITGCMLSAVTYGGWSLGASGAIFGLMGALLYFGFHYRLYLDSVLKTQIIPLIILNVFLGFILPNIDIFGHIGGLIAGFFITMALGVKNKSSMSDKINGIICSTILVAFLIVLLFIVK